MNNSEKVSLREEEKQSFIHFIIEKFILCRWQFWKNNPRVNMMIIKAAISVAAVSFIGLVIATIFYFTYHLPINGSASFFKLSDEIGGIEFKSWLKLGFLLSGSTTIAYWNMSTMFNKKWTYVVDLYNKIIQLDSSKKTELLRNALAIDLLTLDLWAHRSLCSLFKNELIKAIKHTHLDNQDDITQALSRMTTGLLTETEAMKYLEYRHNILTLPASPDLK